MLELDRFTVNFSTSIIIRQNQLAYFKVWVNLTLDIIALCTQSEICIKFKTS